MRKILYFVVCLLCVSGCGPSLDQLRAENQQNLMKLSIGMGKDEVIKLMGEKKVQATDGFFIKYKPGATNPYRRETLQGKDKVFEVLYYYTDIKKRNQTITDDELTPLVFDNGKLIGWGWSFLGSNVQKYEIRIR